MSGCNTPPKTKAPHKVKSFLPCSKEQGSALRETAEETFSEDFQNFLEQSVLYVGRTQSCAARPSHLPPLPCQEPTQQRKIEAQRDGKWAENS